MNPELPRLLSQPELAASGVVANCRMNRERRLTGRNSYQADLRFDIVEFLSARIGGGDQVRWLDLCCGSGLALLEADEHFSKVEIRPNLHLLGIDLVDFFGHPNQRLRFTNFAVTNLESWTTNETYDLITCVHGLHYIGDKLGLIQKCCRWLKSDGVFLAHLDLQNLRFEATRNTSRMLLRNFREADLDYHRRFHLLKCQGQREISWNCCYLGSDDSAGPNFTGQPAVNSHYQRSLNNL